MSKLLRYHSGNAICFVTTVTHLRMRILVENSDILIGVLSKFSKTMNFQILAYSILPDHMHLLIDCNENDLSEIMRKIKLSFTKKFKYRHKIRAMQLWQKRFWDHIIRDEDDLSRHVDYIHFNPVKHGLIDNPFEWKYSTIQEYLRNGYYLDDWGLEDNDFAGEFGE